MTIKTQLNKSISSDHIRSAFTLIEFLVSLAIVLMLIVAASAVEVRYLRMASNNKHSLTAQDLAESCMNKIRQKRDQNLLNPPAGGDAFTGVDAAFIAANCPPPAPIDGVTYSISGTVTP